MQRDDTFGLDDRTRGEWKSGSDRFCGTETGPIENEYRRTCVRGCPCESNPKAHTGRVAVVVGGQPPHWVARIPGGGGHVPHAQSAYGVEIVGRLGEDRDRSLGLYGKYHVQKIVNAGPDCVKWVDPGPVFVLAYSKDPHARVALAAYIESCRGEFPLLAADLSDELNRTDGGGSK